ncbi:Biomphalysin 10 [Biomphalaria glabrata]|nr:Biomphalysin 10 [Biomphalaria glabrata]
MVFQLIVFFVLVKTTHTACTKSSWLTSFDSAGQSMCDEVDYYIRGFERSSANGDHSLNRLEGVECCSAPTPWSDMELLVVYQDWTYDLDTGNHWVFCPNGYFLQGLQRSQGRNLDNIEAARCTKPAIHPHRHSDCYDEDISSCFDGTGLCSCRENYFVTGLYRSKCNSLQCLDKLECCKMADKLEELDGVSKVKTRIMDATLSNMANLAHLMGYGWCSGCMSNYVGEDFYRDGETWKANQNGTCNGYKSDQRLSLVFSNWKFAIKNIKYGESVTDEIQPSTLDKGMTRNNDSETATDTYEISETIMETITHSSTSSWTNRIDLGLSVTVQIPLMFPQSSLSSTSTFTTSFEQSSSNTKDQSTANSKTFKKTIEKSIAPFSAAEYEVILHKTRTTVPYTATIIAKFSTEFRGFLRWDGGNDSPTSNYHYQFKGSEDRPTFNYRFGDDSEAFYSALKKEIITRSKPWLWKDIITNYPDTQHLINRLIDESQYEFTLSGTFEHVAGKRIDVLWNKVSMTKREAHFGSRRQCNIIKRTHYARPGPNDAPAIVKYPEVTLVNSEPYREGPHYVENKSA